MVGEITEYASVAEFVYEQLAAGLALQVMLYLIFYPTGLGRWKDIA